MKKLELTKKQLKELQELADELTRSAKFVVKDYIDNPSDMSGSITQVHEDSPLLATREERLITFNDKKLKIKSDAD